MIRAAIIERSKEKKEMVKAGIKDIGFEISVSDYSNEYDFKENLDDEATSFDLVLLNTTIHREGDGIELAHYLRVRNQKVMICFITESTNYYQEAFKVFATGYLVYPFDIGELYNCINFFFSKTKAERRASWMLKEKGGNYRRIFCRYIVYIESANREILVHLEDGSTIASYCKMDDAEANLPSEQFLRCHQSYIINLYFVEELERSIFHLSGADVPISRKYQISSKEAYYDYMFNKV